MFTGQHDGNGYYEVTQLCKTTKKYIIKNIKLENRYLNNKTWFIHSSELPVLFKRAKDTGNHPILDYSSLPDYLQNNINNILNKIKKLPSNNQDDYALLHLTNTAPEFIIETVYKTLVKKYHPDVGGDNEFFIKIKAAYERISSRLNKSREGTKD